MPRPNKRQRHLQLVRAVLEKKRTEARQAETAAKSDKVEDGHEGNGTKKTECEIEAVEDGHKWNGNQEAKSLSVEEDNIELEIEEFMVEETAGILDKIEEVVKFARSNRSMHYIGNAPRIQRRKRAEQR
uniref:Uncharacterized protein n=1 Tax=Peronospora matthiolae TaxID=2874970 RepID=A0AAV1TPP5_9STRA